MTATLFLDMESTGLIRKDRPLSDPSQPRCVAFAVKLTGPLFPRPVKGQHIVRAEEGTRMTPEAEAVHGIPLRTIQKVGIPEVVMLSLLANLAKDADIIVTYGTFDRDLVISLLRRRGKPDSVWTAPGLVVYNAAEVAKHVCKLPFDDPDKAGEHRWPSLDEACEILLGEPPREGIHDPLEDVEKLERLWTYLTSHNLVEGYS